MEFSNWETVKEVMQDHKAVYWSVFDSTNKRLLNKSDKDLAPETSFEKLKNFVDREQGDFVNIRLDQRPTATKNEGGAVRSFGPYMIRLVSAPQNKNYSEGSINGVPVEHYQEMIGKVRSLEMDKLRMELSERPSALERFFETDSGQQLLSIGSQFIAQKLLPQQNLSGPASGSEDLPPEIVTAVKTILAQQDGGQVIVNIAHLCPALWPTIRQGMIEKNLLKDS